MPTLKEAAEGLAKALRVGAPAALAAAALTHHPAFDALLRYDELFYRCLAATECTSEELEAALKRYPANILPALVDAVMAGDVTRAHIIDPTAELERLLRESAMRSVARQAFGGR